MGGSTGGGGALRPEAESFGGAAAAPRPSPDRLRAFSIADIAAETASFAGCFCAIVPALSLLAAASP